jgi:putative NAD(P)H nitroreductase
LDFSELVNARHSVRQFETGVTISDQELQTIFEQVVASPSSFNLQHWQFVIVREPTRKTELRSLSFGQAQVEQCSAVVLVCGNLNAHADAERIYADSDAQMRDKYVPMIEGVYKGQLALQREEAVRSGALAAMSLMYAARNRGWDCGPMIGFDADAVAAMLDLPEHVVPVMMMVMGRAEGGRQPPRGYRRPLQEVVHFESFGQTTFK